MLTCVLSDRLYAINYHVYMCVCVHARVCVCIVGHGLVKACRQCMRPNDAFVDQMAKYEVFLKGKQISNVESLYHL